MERPIFFGSNSLIFACLNWDEKRCGKTRGFLGESTPSSKVFSFALGKGSGETYGRSSMRPTVGRDDDLQ